MQVRKTARFARMGALGSCRAIPKPVCRCGKRRVLRGWEPWGAAARFRSPYAGAENGPFCADGSPGELPRDSEARMQVRKTARFARMGALGSCRAIPKPVCRCGKRPVLRGWEPWGAAARFRSPYAGAENDPFCADGSPGELPRDSEARMQVRKTTRFARMGALGSCRAIPKPV